MTPDVTLAAIVLAPVAILLFFRVNAALVFLSLCLGSVLVQFVAGDTSDLLYQHAEQVPQIANADNNTVKIVLLLLPTVLTAIFMIRTIHGTGSRLLNILPAIGVGLLGALLVVPLLPGDLSSNITDSSLWNQATNVQNIIIGASAVVCMIVLWMQRPKTGGGFRRKSKH